MNQKVIESVAASLGLKVSTVVDLLNAGWTFTEKMGQPRRWEGPEAKVVRPVREFVEVVKKLERNAANSRR